MINRPYLTGERIDTFTREIDVVYSNIFVDWGKTFVAETIDLRSIGRHLHIIMDFYSAHTRYSTLKYLIIESSSFDYRRTPHTYCNLSMFLYLALFKSFVTQERDKLARKKPVVDAFVISNVLSLAF